MLYDITYIWNLNCDTNELIYKTETDIENQTCGCQGSGVRGGWIGNLGLEDTNHYIENG